MLLFCLHYLSHYLEACKLAGKAKSASTLNNPLNLFNRLSSLRGGRIYEVPPDKLQIKFN